MKKNSFSYCEGSYLSLKATMHKWGDPNWTRFLTRIFYNSMFGAGTNPTGFISEAALQNKLKKEKTCQDHYLSPQFMGRMILDNQEKYLCDLETYTKMFKTNRGRRARSARNRRRLASAGRLRALRARRTTFLILEFPTF